ncbi:MAG: hypothetical protein BHW56_07150 [Acetobacter sp. 46_36]|nr:MAG: hypothetical protein BHW56_07150 [Acetobacter sp. 46_36]
MLKIAFSAPSHPANISTARTKAAAVGIPYPKAGRSRNVCKKRKARKKRNVCRKKLFFFIKKNY